MTRFDRAEFQRRVLAVVDGERDYRLIERLVVAQRDAGVSDAVLLEALTDVADDLAEQDRDEDDVELVLNAADFLTGW